jgi:hypothetical protein
MGSSPDSICVFLRHVANGPALPGERLCRRSPPTLKHPSDRSQRGAIDAYMDGDGDPSAEAKRSKVCDVISCGGTHASPLGSGLRHLATSGSHDVPRGVHDRTLSRLQR